jgi:hypothetical protein
MRLETLTPYADKIRYQQNLRSTTWRGFDGGWSVLDDDMSLSYKFAPILDNCYHDSNGITRVRQGFELFVNITNKFSDPLATIIDVFYFNSALIAVASNGEVIKVTGDAIASRIWDSTVAAALPGAPSAWGATDFASSAVFNGHLIVCNGIDKPIDIDGDFFVEYLQDAATNTNINVPICKYVVSLGRFLVMAGDPLELDRVHISAQDAAGTWFGDPPPNNATHLDVGSVVSGATTIRGLLGFRGRLVVMFAEGMIFGTLGVFDDNGNHTPDLSTDFVEGFGSISHRSAVAYGDDGLFLDLEGVPSIRRTVLSTSFKPERVSELIDPEIKAMLKSLSFEALENRTFSVYHKEEGQFILFIPDAELLADTTETVGFVYNYRPQLKQESWARFRDMNFTSAVRSLAGNLFFGDASGNIWLYGSRKNNSIDTDYTIAGEGDAINFVWEWPWVDLGSRDRSKDSKHIAFDTRGASEFTVDMFVDNFDNDDQVALSMRFSGGEQGEYGDGDQPFGGGRNTSRKKHFAWPCKFEIAKLRFSGASDAGLAIVSVSMRYLIGGINR